MTTTIREGGPPRPALGYETRQLTAHDAGVNGQNARPRCSAHAYNEEGERGDCRWYAAMTWFGVPFCAKHAPTKKPGMAGWIRLQ